MTSFDDDLREALRPLAGDPKATARAVLQQLPPHRRRPWHEVALWLGSAAAALLIGLMVGRSTAPSVESKPVAKPKDATPKAATPPPVTAPFALVRAVVGHATASRGAGEPAQSLEPLTVLTAGSVVETASSALAELRFADGTLLRMNQNSAVDLEGERSVRLQQGQVWLLVEGGPGHLDHAEGRVELEPQTAIDANSDAKGLFVANLSGSAVVVSHDDTERRLRPQQACRVRDGILGNREYIYWPFEITQWQLGLFCANQAREELAAMAAPLLEMLSSPDFGSMAESGLRRMGACAMEPLLDFVEQADPVRERSTRSNASELLAETASYAGLDRLFGLLGDSDPNVRVAMYHAIKRVSGVDWADDRFWSSGAGAERSTEAKAWLQRIRG